MDDTNFGSKDAVEVAMFLKENGIADDVCETFEGADIREVLKVYRYVCIADHVLPCRVSLSITENEIDGQAFLDLSEDDVKSLTSKLGVVKKICRLKAVRFCVSCLWVISCDKIKAGPCRTFAGG